MWKSSLMRQKRSWIGISLNARHLQFRWDAIITKKGMKLNCDQYLDTHLSVHSRKQKGRHGVERCLDQGQNSLVSRESSGDRVLGFLHDQRTVNTTATCWMRWRSLIAVNDVANIFVMLRFFTTMFDHIHQP